MQRILTKVLHKITPSQKEVLAEAALVSEIRKKLAHLDGEHSHLEWCGSSARGTHLRGDKDIDLFIMFNKTLPAEKLETEGLRLAEQLFGKNKWEKAYSQHPYLRGKIKGFEVEIVPSYIVASGAEKQSAVDRTPFHNKYLLARMSTKQQQDARLLKQFLKGINAYGADLKNCALPGYGVELLILHFGSFTKALQGIARMKAGHVIDFGTGVTRAQELFMHNHYPLIIIDPVDDSRNVASALSITQFGRMVLAARTFLKKPDSKFFFPKKTRPLALAKIKKALIRRELIAIKGTFPKKILADLVWGQLRRFAKKTEHYLQELDFEVLMSDVWSDEKDVYFVFELATLTLPAVKKVIGPPAEDALNTQRFMSKKRTILAGPRVENGRIVLEVTRDVTSAHKALTTFITQSQHEEKDALKLTLTHARVISEATLLKHYKYGFAEYLSTYLAGKETFE